jgi:hypothetical protein
MVYVRIRDKREDENLITIYSLRCLSKVRFYKK